MHLTRLPSVVMKFYGLATFNCGEQALAMSGSNISLEFSRLLRIDTPTVSASLSFVENVTVFVPLSRTFRVLFGRNGNKINFVDRRSSNNNNSRSKMFHCSPADVNAR